MGKLFGVTVARNDTLDWQVIKWHEVDDRDVDIYQGLQPQTRPGWFMIAYAVWEAESYDRAKFLRWWKKVRK